MTSRCRRATCALSKLLATAALLLPPVAAASGLELDLRLRTEHYPAAAGDGFGSRARVQALWRQQYDAWRLKLGGRATVSDSPWGHGQQLDADEISLSHMSDLGTLTLGRQQIAWGRADGFRLLDSVNPLRWPDALFDDAQDARLPQWMLNWEAQAADWQWQVFAGHDRQLHASDPAFPQFRADGDARPRTRVAAEFAGGRLGRRLADLDISLYALRGPDPQPLWRPSPQGLQRLDARRNLLGLSGDATLGGLVLRGEWVYSENSALDAQLNPAQQRTTQALLGLDWEQGAWFISPQLYHQQQQLRDGGNPRTRADYTSLLLQHKSMQDRLQLRAFALHGFSTGERWYSLTLSYDVHDHWQWRLALDHFAVDRAPAGALPSAAGGLLSPFADLDRLSLEAIIRY